MGKGRQHGSWRLNSIQAFSASQGAWAFGSTRVGPRAFPGPRQGHDRMVVSPGWQRHQLKRTRIWHAGFQPHKRHLKPFTSSPLRVFVGDPVCCLGPPCHEMPRREAAASEWQQWQLGAGWSAGSIALSRPLRGVSTFTFAPRAFREAEQATSQLLSQGGSGEGGALMAPGRSVLPGAASQITAQWTWKETQMRHQGITPCPHHPIPLRPLEESWSSDCPIPPMKGALWTPFPG